MAGSEALINLIRVLATLMKDNLCQNTSFHPQADFIEISDEEERDKKFPAIIIRGPKINEDLNFRSEGPRIIINQETGEYISTPTPIVCDVYFNIIILSEGDIEGLQLISKSITFFASTPQITVKDSILDTVGKIYNVNLIDPIEESRIANISDIVRYEGKFCIEGLEFSSGEDTIGKIAKEVNPNVNNK
jgi:DNA polymerase III delta prime subunit